MKKRSIRLLLLLVASTSLAACTGSLYGQLPSREAAYAIIPPMDKAVLPTDYLIESNDIVGLVVFGEPGLTLDKLPVDAAGYIQVPLVGPVQVIGLTAAKASAAIALRLGARFLRNPDVTLNVIQRTGQVVTVEGQVTRAGSYTVDSETTLLGAIALAQSPTRIAKLDQIIVFRTINGERLAAKFNVSRIRAGRDADPQILGGDVVVVGYSQVKAIYRDVLQAAPIFNIFTRF